MKILISIHLYSIPLQTYISLAFSQPTFTNEKKNPKRIDQFLTKVENDTSGLEEYWSNNNNPTNILIPFNILIRRVPGSGKIYLYVVAV